VIILTLTEIAGFIGLLATYGMTYSSINDVDISALRYIVANKCSDAVLYRASSVFSDSYDHDMLLLRLGFFFVVASFTVIYGLFIVLLICRPCFARCCKCLDEDTYIETHALSLKEKVKSLSLKDKVSIGIISRLIKKDKKML